ncbi:MAG TPA: HAD hydrolase family protein [Myxococcota bacterium]|nr:HAD hydrolase family protein [Myxococcota bacterium]
MPDRAQPRGHHNPAAGNLERVGRVQALGDLGISHHSAIAIGDAENHHSLLETCELGVAVSNAVDALKTHADLVLEEPDGAGVAAFLRGPVLCGEVRIEPKRWQLELGRYEDGSRVRLPASQINMLITGRSKSGKSHLAGRSRKRRRQSLRTTRAILRISTGR